MNAATAVAPAKLILMGEHAVVYDRPALVAAIGLWLRVTVRPRATGAGVDLHLKDLDRRVSTDWSSIRSYANTVRQRWETYASNPTAEAFAHMQGDEPAHVVKVALGETDRRLSSSLDPSLEVTVQSEQPIGAGFGSSAAVAVSVAQAYRESQGAELDDEGLYDLVLDVERRQHGTPSGVDPATILQGGVVWADHAGDQPEYRTVTRQSPVLEGFRVFDTGRPNESTGTVVDAVRERRERDPEVFCEILDRIETATRRLRSVLAETTTPHNEVLQATRHVEAGLEALGVVPEPVQRLIRTIEKGGGAAKISGAGALSGSKAGSLLVYHPDPEPDLCRELQVLPEFDVDLGVEGARVQRGSK